MNKLSLAAEHRTWWLPTAIAGGIGTVALGAILVLPTGGQSDSEKDAPNAPGVSIPFDGGVARTCHSLRPPRPYGVDDFAAPVCR